MLVLALTVSIVVLLFATGMSVTVKDVTWLWRRPVLLGKSALAMYVVAPVVPRKLIKLEGDARP
jgi:BASS family bile acid:Na+ symporter